LSARLEKPVAAMAAVTMVVRLGDGEAGAFWYDSWLPVGPLCRHAPHLFRAISRTDRKRTIKDALMHNRWASDIRGALTTQVLCQYLQVWEMLRRMSLNPLQSDRFVWRWSADDTYSASSAYYPAGSSGALEGAGTAARQILCLDGVAQPPLDSFKYFMGKPTIYLTLVT